MGSTYSVAPGYDIDVLKTIKNASLSSRTKFKAYIVIPRLLHTKYTQGQPGQGPPAGVLSRDLLALPTEIVLLKGASERRTYFNYWFRYKHVFSSLIRNIKS